MAGEVHGYEKEGTCYGYTRERGYHPLLATRAGSDEVLHIRLRKGSKGSANTQRGALRFVDELIARVRRAGAVGEILLRVDSGFWNKKITARLRAKGCLYSIGVRITKLAAAAIGAIPD
ncbi:MAG: transposase [Thermoleophilia bacterium]|nr:transposase [Thermoleophilia bacterium]